MVVIKVTGKLFFLLEHVNTHVRSILSLRERSPLNMYVVDLPRSILTLTMVRLQGAQVITPDLGLGNKTLPFLC